MGISTKILICGELRNSVIVIASFPLCQHSCRLDFKGDNYANNPVPIDVKTKGQTWLLPPYNWSHRRIAKELDVSPSVVSKWRNELVESDLLSTEPSLENTTDYSAEQRFFIVIETETMSERKLAEYCRSKGVFVDDVKAWRALSIKAQSTTLTPI